MKSFPTVDT